MLTRQKQSDVTPAPVTASSTAECAYCGSPLEPDVASTDSSRTGGARFCCYGCRLLFQSRQQGMPRPAGSRSIWFKAAVAGAIAGQQMLLGLAVNLSPPGGVTRLWLHLALILSSLTVMGLLGPSLLEALREDLRARRLSIEMLFVTSMAGAFAASLYATMTGEGAVYYEVTSIVLVIYTVGKTLGASCRSRALLEARQLSACFETCRVIMADGAEVTRKIRQLRGGELVRVLPGEPIPIDGEIVSGHAFIRDPFFGEPHPVVKRPGDTLLAGSYSEDGELLLAARGAQGSRRLDDFLALINRGDIRESAWQREAERITQWFLPLVLVTAIATFFYWGLARNWGIGLFNSMAVLLVACPCALGLATPVGLWSALARLASRGLAARSAGVVDRLAQVDCVVFDKTGTLTEDQLTLSDLATARGPGARREVLAILSLINRHTPHPVARAFASAAAIAPRGECRSLKVIPGAGIEAWILDEAGREIHLRLGERSLMSSLAGETDLLGLLRATPADRLVYLELDGRLEAAAALREQLRPSAAPAITALAAEGIETLIFTGDRAERAAQLGLETVSGSLAPEEKMARLMEKAQAGKKVCYVGDGLNDAAAMQASFVGLALNPSAPVTAAQSHGVIFGGDLMLVPWAIRFSRQVRASIRSNLVFASVYNLVGLALAATGLLHPVAAALLMVTASAIVSWRAFFSAQRSVECCFPRPRESPAAAPMTRGWGSAMPGLLIAAQGPFLIWLGQLAPAPAPALMVLLFLAALGVTAARFRGSGDEITRYARMTFAMLGPGNWGMLLGWWMDSGWQRPLACPGFCGQEPHLTAFLHGPWMLSGMLLAGLPPMIAKSTRGFSPAWRNLNVSLAALGMVVGMVWGGSAAATFSQAFLAHYAGMTLGMLAGMFLGCELARSLWLRFKK